MWLIMVLLALAGPVAPAHAAESGWADLSGVWTWLESWLPWMVETGDQCSSIDPNGGCRGDVAAATVDQCSHIDPDGRCGGTDSLTSDQGFSVDPDG
ncbi:MAG TPA: hypothetical protein VKM72_26105 [Thermoanaerobaculia bacterium]|nr:hypothetical protein [Thermoanaerobaculia bacterium]